MKKMLIFVFALFLVTPLMAQTSEPAYTEYRQKSHMLFIKCQFDELRVPNPTSEELPISEGGKVKYFCKFGKVTF